MFVRRKVLFFIRCPTPCSIVLGTRTYLSTYVVKFHIYLLYKEIQVNKMSVIKNSFSIPRLIHDTGQSMSILWKQTFYFPSLVIQNHE